MHILNCADPKTVENFKSISKESAQIDRYRELEYYYQNYIQVITLVS